MVIKQLQKHIYVFLLKFVLLYYYYYRNKWVQNNKVIFKEKSVDEQPSVNVITN